MTETMTFMVIGLDPNGLAMLKVPELSLNPGSQVTGAEWMELWCRQMAG